MAGNLSNRCRITVLSLCYPFVRKSTGNRWISTSATSWLTRISPAEQLEAAVAAARTAVATSSSGAAGIVTRSQQSANADYQCNVSSIAPSKDQLQSTAESISRGLSLHAAGALCTASAGGRGFVNIRLQDGWLLANARNVAADEFPADHARVSAISPALVDCGSPNMGKELHVGHLRSGVVGDTLARLLRARGAAVDVVSHVGDAGVPLALVLWQLVRTNALSRDACSSFWSQEGRTPSCLTPAGLSHAYLVAKQATAKDKTAMADVQTVLRDLQRVLAAVAAASSSRLGIPSPFAPQGTAVLEDAGLAVATGLDEQQTRLYEAWRTVCAASRRGYAPLFARLNVGAQEPGGTLPEQGEACYSHLLQPVVQDLCQAGVAVEDDGALCMFVDGREKPPLLVRKADGGFLYATTDMTAVRARLARGYGRLVYVTDAGQSAHFNQVFAAAGMAGWTSGKGSGLLNSLHPSGSPSPVLLQHASFGVVTGPGGKKLSSRDGTEQTLAGLLAEGQDRLAELRAQLRRERSEAKGLDHSTSPVTVEDEATEVDLAARLSASCARFFDLLHQRGAAYAYDQDRVLDVRGKGDSATYVLYARIRLNTLRKVVSQALAQAGLAPSVQPEAALGWMELMGAATRKSPAAAALASFDPSVPQERALALAVASFPDALAVAERTLAPHHVAHATLALAGAAHAFYASARLLPAEQGSLSQLTEAHWATMHRRLVLAAAAETALTAACGILGLHKVDQM